MCTEEIPLKPLICQLPYPSAENLQKDVRSGRIISFAYATLCGEISATLQYLYHSLHLTNKQHAEVLESIALAEMKHTKILAECMLKLGVNPLYVQYPCSQTWFNTSQISRSTAPQKMLMDDVQGEMNAITEYKKMLYVLTNQDVAAIVQRIILDEQLHLDALKELLEKQA